jgi:hypothetical protein
MITNGDSITLGVTAQSKQSWFAEPSMTDL